MSDDDDCLPLRQRQALQAMADGLSYAELGRNLFITEDTVKVHVRKLFERIGAKSRSHAVAIGFRRGWLS